MISIKELINEIDWSLYDDSDLEQDKISHIEELSTEDILGENHEDNIPIGQRRAELIIRSRMNIAKRAKQIRREAIENNDDLTALISRKQLNELIRVITQPDTDKINEIMAHMNKSATIVLRRHIPADLVRAYIKYKDSKPWVIPQTPGFIYFAPKDWGHHYNLWLIPNIPQYITQFTEYELIKKDQQRFNLINKYLVRYHKLIKDRTKLEMHLASKLYNICTRYDLLVKNADFYKLYMDNKLYEL